MCFLAAITVKGVFTFLYTLTGFLSAIFWVVSACAGGRRISNGPDAIYAGGGIIANGRDLFKTLRKQSKWNAWAASCAAITVVLQIASTFL